MSLRTSRRSQAAAASVEEVPSVPISEIRARKWTKQIKNVGHITVVKWVPEQEHPTEALQRGGFKKTKGRKRPVAEVGRMTRSVRQHLDAPLELLVEMPPVRQSTRATASLGIVPTPNSAPEAAAVPPATAAPTDGGSVPAAPVAPTTTAPAPPAMMPNVTSSESLLGMSGDSMMFSEGVASEEQLERELDDLPFLDSDNLAMDPALAIVRQDTPAQPQPAAVATTQAATQPGPASVPQEPGMAATASVEPAAQPSPDASASAASAEDDGASSSSSSSDDDDDDDDGNETASVDSATPQQSPSPTMMSRSPSP